MNGKVGGRKSRFKKCRWGEEYQVVGNYIHPWLGLNSSTAAEGKKSIEKREPVKPLQPKATIKCRMKEAVLQIQFWPNF